MVESKDGFVPETRARAVFGLYIGRWEGSKEVQVIV